MTATLIEPRSADWLGSWGETAAALEATTTITFPLLAAAAAWLTSSPRRRRYEPLLASSARSRVEIVGRLVVRVTALAATGMVAVAAAAYLLTGLQATFDRPQLMPVVVVVCGLGAASAFGALCGALLPSIVGPVVALAAVYAIEVLTDTGNPKLSPLAGLTVADPRERTYRHTLTWVLDVRGLYLLALATLFVFIAARRSGSWLLPFAATCLLATPLLLTGDANMTISPAATKMTCSTPSKRLDVCMTAARAHVEPQVATALGPLVTDLAGIAPDGVALIEENLTPTPKVTVVDGTLRVPFGVVNGVTGNAHQVDTDDIRAQFVSRVLGETCPPEDPADAGGKPPARPNDVIGDWLLRRHHVPDDGTGGLDYPLLSPDVLDYTRIAAFKRSWDTASNPQRHAWLSEHGPQVIACTVDPADTVDAAAGSRG